MNNISWSAFFSKTRTGRSNHPEVFLKKGVLKICSKFTGERPTLSCEATLLKSHFRIGVPVKLLHIFRTPFHKNTSGQLLLNRRRSSIIMTLSKWHTSKVLIKLMLTLTPGYNCILIRTWEGILLLFFRKMSFSIESF